MTENLPNDSTVVVVDDDASVREAMKELFESVGLKVIERRSAQTTPGVVMVVATHGHER